MKKYLIAILAIVGTLALTGCPEEDEAPAAATVGEEAAPDNSVEVEPEPDVVVEEVEVVD